MPSVTWLGHHRLWTAAFVTATVVVVVALVAAGVWFFVIRSPATQVDLHEALHIYRKQQGSSPAAGLARLPAPGVYRYQTTGGEQLSIAGISRSFPSTSQMIVTAANGCATMKWEPLTQHIEGWVACPERTGGLEITSAPSYEQIAGAETTSVIRCPAGMYFVPPRPFTGERWSITCHSPGETVLFSGRVLGQGSVNVGDAKVPALHTEIDLSFAGAQSGQNPNDIWVSPATGLILRQSETVNVTQQAGPLGSVRYQEHMAIALTSMVPVR
jgi:hypothetical protein